MKKKFALILSFLLSFTALCACNDNEGDSSSGSSNGADSLTKIEAPVESNQPVLLIGSEYTELIIGESFKLNYVLKYSEAVVSFNSIDTSIATVDASGNVTAKGVGETYIAVQAGECYETCLVRVNAEPTYRIICNDGDILLVEGSEFILNAVLKKGLDLVDATLTYESMDTTVATVQNGTIKGVGFGDTQIKISCTYENEYFEKLISVSVGNAVYIDVEAEVTLAYRSASNLEYQIRTFDEEVVGEAVAEIKSSNSSVVSVVGNTLTANDCGKVTLTVTYGKVSVEVFVNVVLDVEMTEYNLFKHNASLENAEVRHFNTNAKCVDPVVVHEAFGETGDFLCVSSLYARSANAAKPSCKYLGLYLPARLTKAEIQALKDEGYTKLMVEYCIQSEMEDAIYVQVLKKAAQGQQNRNVKATDFGTWFTFKVSIDDILVNYDALADKTQMFFGLAVENEVDEFKLYMKPLRFSK